MPGRPRPRSPLPWQFRPGRRDRTQRRGHRIHLAKPAYLRDPGRGKRCRGSGRVAAGTQFHRRAHRNRLDARHHPGGRPRNRFRQSGQRSQQEVFLFQLLRPARRQPNGLGSKLLPRRAHPAAAAAGTRHHRKLLRLHRHLAAGRRHGRRHGDGWRRRTGGRTSTGRPRHRPGQPDARHGPAGLRKGSGGTGQLGRARQPLVPLRDENATRRHRRHAGNSPAGG